MASGGMVRAMSAWFVDPDHIVVPVIKRRLCVDFFMAYTAYVAALLGAIWGAVTAFLGFGMRATPYPAMIAGICAAILVWVVYGEWAVGHKKAGHVYSYMVGLWWLALGLVWAGTAGYVQIRQVRRGCQSGGCSGVM